MAGTDTSNSSSPPLTRRSSKGRWIGLIVVLAVFAGVFWWVWHQRVTPGQPGAGAPAAGARGGRGGLGGPGANRTQPVSVAAVQQRDIRVTAQAIGSIA